MPTNRKRTYENKQVNLILFRNNNNNYYNVVPANCYGHDASSSVIHVLT